MPANMLQWLDLQLTAATNKNVGFTMLPATQPYRYNAVTLQTCRAKYQIISEFFEASLQVFRLALEQELDPRILQWLLNDTPTWLGDQYHRQLVSCHLTSPIFYRTDEALSGRIFEIQCPGSLWGEHQLLWEYFSSKGADEHQLGRSIADQFTEALATILPDEPRIHHLLDNASIPHTVEFFIQRTRPTCKYFGYDPRLRPEDCNLVRSHSFFGLVAQNEALRRLKQCREGTLHYDLPPHVLFDQKVTLCLPFMPETRDLFTNSIRDIILFTQLVRPEGFTLENGQWTTLNEFAALPRSQRQYMLKYAGSDVSRNWGARAVSFLGNVGKEKCQQMLMYAANEVSSGSVWIIQRAEMQQEDVESIAAEGSSGPIKSATVKRSGFYGPKGYMGSLVMHRHFYKVHGQNDTITSIAGFEAALV